MIYIVSGFMRTGTSMMMAALKAGGMEICYSLDRNKIAKRHADEKYDPNPLGLFEIPLKEYDEPNFPHPDYEDKVIKVMSWGLEKLRYNSQGYKIILMRREFEEIRQSYEAFLGVRLQKLKFDEKMNKLFWMLNARSDVEIQSLHYREVVEHPVEQFQQLKTWPIDPHKAASVIKPELYRFRLENLIPGI